MNKWHKTSEEVPKEHQIVIGVELPEKNTLLGSCPTYIDKKSGIFTALYLNGDQINDIEDYPICSSLISLMFWEMDVDCDDTEYEKKDIDKEKIWYRLSYYDQNQCIKSPHHWTKIPSINLNPVKENIVNKNFKNLDIE